MRNMIDSQDDLQLLMRQFMTKQQLWLFKRSKNRVVSLNHPLVNERVRGKDFDALQLLGWDASDEIDQQLLKEYFNQGGTVNKTTSENSRYNKIDKQLISDYFHSRSDSEKKLAVP